MIDKLKKIKAEIFYVRNPVPNRRKISIEFYVPTILSKEQIEEKIIDTIYMYNNEIIKDVIKEIKYKEIKK